MISMPVAIFKRKIYDKMLEWKRDYSGKYALLIEGARRVGKTTVVEQFIKNEYRSAIIIDFSL
jgi:predicted AAA+ superfamily ATPase